MNLLSRNGGTGRDLVPTHAVTDADREEMRGWIQTLRSEAAGLRGQARLMNQVAQDAEALADRIENVLRSAGS